MGSENSKEKRMTITNEQQELVFYTNVQDQVLGDVQIFTSRKVPLCYILKYQRKFSDTKIYNLFKKIQELQCTALLSLYGFRVDRKLCCNQILNQVVTSYWEYYNFYFSDYLEKRSTHTCMFVETELWHMVDVCCETYNMFRKFGIYYEINPQTFVVTPEGKLKAVWSHLKSQNSHMKYIEYFDKTGYAQKFYYAPEELEYMYIHERTIKIDFDKCNSFRLGMILLQCLTLQFPMRICYNPSMTKINFNLIKNLILNKVMPSYPKEIVLLIRSLLKEDPRERPTLIEVYDIYNKFFNSEYELRVCGGKPKQSYGRENENLQQEMEMERGDAMNRLLEKKASDFSDVKTVKLSHSIRKA